VSVCVCVCVCNQPNIQPKYKVQKIKNTYFGNEVKTLCTKEKNHSRAVKPKKSTI
jgi:hypothetical protein